MKQILVLGGTRFFGRHLVELLIADGHKVTVMTRGQSGNPFGNKVEHIIVDRLNQQALEKAVEGRFFDIVYDNICYSPEEAYQFCQVFNGKINKLVFTSTLAVYNADGLEKHEADFDPYQYEIKLNGRESFNYADGKRQAEAVFYKYAAFPVVAVRFPIVLGEDDYTQRLHFHIEHVMHEKPIGFKNMDAQMSFILATEAAQFLRWVGLAQVEGPINATASGCITLTKLMELIEAAAGKAALITLEKDADNPSPYAIADSWYMSNKKASELGFKFTHLDDWLEELIVVITKKLK